MADADDMVDAAAIASTESARAGPKSKRGKHKRTRQADGDDDAEGAEETAKAPQLKKKKDVTNSTSAEGPSTRAKPRQQPAAADTAAAKSPKDTAAAKQKGSSGNTAAGSSSSAAESTSAPGKASVGNKGAASGAAAGANNEDSAHESIPTATTGQKGDDRDAELAAFAGRGTDVKQDAKQLTKRSSAASSSSAASAASSLASATRLANLSKSIVDKIAPLEVKGGPVADAVREHDMGVVLKPVVDLIAAVATGVAALLDDQAAQRQAVYSAQGAGECRFQW